MPHLFRRAGARLSAPTALVLLLAACGPTAQDQVTPQRFVDAPEVSEAAAQAYGEEAEEAYEVVAEFLLDHSYELPLIDPEHTSPTAEELSEVVTPMLATDAATDWAALVEADLAGDTDARDAVRLLRFHAWDAEGSSLASPDRPLNFQTITDGTVDLGEVTATAETDDAAATADPAQPPLLVTLVHRASVALQDARVPYDVLIEKPLQFTLVQDGDSWLIETFEGSMSLEYDGAVQTDDSEVTVDPTDTLDATTTTTTD